MNVHTDTEHEAPPEVESTSSGAKRTARFRLPAGRKRVALIVTLIAVLVLTGGFLALKSGKSVLGLRSGEGVLSFLPVWLPENAAFQYGERTVTVDELNAQVDLLRALYGVQAPTDPAKLAGFRRDAAKAYAVGLVLDDAAREQGMVIADKTARDTLTKFIADKVGEGPEGYSAFIDTLAEGGTNEQAVIDELKRRLALAKLFDAVTEGTPPVTDADTSAAFEKRKDQLGAPEQRKVSNIVVRTREEAERVLAELKGGAAFDDTARKVSLDGSTRTKGGALGYVAAEQLEQAYADAAFGVERGQLFGPVQSQHGWNVGTVTGIRPSRPADFETVRDALKQRLGEERVLDQWRSWLADRITNARVRYAEDYRPADPAALPDDGSAGSSPMTPPGR